jgi:hypothetical protein
MDDRENFFFSSSRAPASENLNTLQLYNYIKGRLRNIPSVGTGSILVSFYSSSNGSPTGSKLSLQAGGSTVSTGDRCDISLTAAATPLQEIHDVWHFGGVEFFTGSFFPELMPTYDSAPTFNRITSCKNLKKIYSARDTARDYLL